MIKQTLLLTKLLMCNVMGRNVAHHTTETSKRTGYYALAGVWAVLGAGLVAYVAYITWALAQMSMGRAALVMLFALSSLLTFLFTFFKAGSVIFGGSSYELLASFPLSGASIVSARFLTMYLPDLAMSVLVMLPGLIVYAAVSGGGAALWVFGLLGTLLLPMLPVTAGTALGAAVTAVGSRMKHKGAVTSVLTLAIAVLVMLASAVMPRQLEGLGMNGQELMAAATQAVDGIYRPAAWFGNSVTGGGAGPLLLYLAASAALFALLVFVLQRHFLDISSAINASASQKGYKLGRLGSGSPVKALWKRELRLYVTSKVYFSNTMIGYVMMLAASAGLLIVGPEKLNEMTGFPGLVDRAYPLLLSLLAIMMPTTAASVSMEGAGWWIAQTMPLTSRQVWNAKILLDLSVAAPFYALSMILSCIALKPTGLELVWLLAVPAAYIVFGAVAGLTANLTFHKLTWESEVEVTKQGMAVLLTMLAMFVSVAPPAVLTLLAVSVPVAPVMLATIVVLLAVSVALYRRCCKKELIDIG